MARSIGFVEEMVQNSTVARVRIPGRAVPVLADKHARVMGFVVGEAVRRPAYADEAGNGFRDEPGDDGDCSSV